MSEENLDRFARGELSPAESRELARTALDNPELFEELTYTAVAREGVAQPKLRRTFWPRLMALAASVLVALLAPYLLRHSAPTAPVTVAVAGPPVFLAHGGDAAAQFRGADTESRVPRSTGAVTSIEDGAVTIDVGSLDGLAKDSDVEVVRDGQPIGSLKLTTVFRERARGQAAPGLTVRPSDQIRVPPPLFLRAALDQIATQAARGDAGGAQKTAAQVAPFDAPGDLTSYDDLNNLAGIALLQHNPAQAQSLYGQALRANPPPAAIPIIQANLARARGAK
jgi:hypothetical protein